MGSSYIYDYRRGRYRRKSGVSSVLLDFGEWELTWRELLFSVLIVGVMSFMGFFAAGYVEKSVLDSQLKYRQAAQLSDPEEFKHAMDTDAGDAFVYGQLEAVDPVSYKGLDGKHLSIEARYQEYRRHTRTYTVSDGKGHTRIRTRHYWSWDTISSDEKHAKTVRFCGREFPYSTFRYDCLMSDSVVVGTGHNRRTVFDVVPKAAVGSVFGKLAGGTVRGTPQFMSGWSIARHYEYSTESYAVVLFWVAWALLTGAVVFAFWYVDNKWLD